MEAAAEAVEEPRFEVDGELPLEVAEVNGFLSYIEEEAGRPFLYPPRIRVEDRTTYEAGLVERFERQAQDFDERLDVVARTYQALGFTDLGVAEVGESVEGFITSADAISGYYNPDTDTVHVPADVLADGAFRALLVHELVHALDGQHADLAGLLDAVEADPENGELAFATAAVIEGRATFVQSTWQVANGVVLQADELPDAVTEAPPAFVVGATLPYGFGAGWVQARGGLAETWVSLDDLPATSEEILVPSVAPGEPVADPAPVAADGDELLRATFGAADLLLLLVGDSLTPAPAEVVSALTVVDGWAGGEMVLWGDEAESCVRFAVLADGEVDRAELEEALAAWATADPGRTLDRDGAAVLVTACAPFRP